MAIGSGVLKVETIIILCTIIMLLPSIYYMPYKTFLRWTPPICMWPILPFYFQNIVHMMGHLLCMDNFAGVLKCFYIIGYIYGAL